MANQVYVRIHKLPGNKSAQEIGNQIANFLRGITSTPVNVNITEEDSQDSLGSLSMLRTLNRGITMGKEQMSLNELDLYREE